QRSLACGAQMGRQFRQLRAAVEIPLLRDLSADESALHLHGRLAARARALLPPQTHDPGIVDKQAELGVVIGVVVRDEDVTQLRQRDFRFNQLEARSVAGVDHVGDVVEDDEIGGRTRLEPGSDRRTTACAERDQAIWPEVSRVLRKSVAQSRRWFTDCCRYRAGTGRKEASTSNHDAISLTTLLRQRARRKNLILIHPLGP